MDFPKKVHPHQSARLIQLDANVKNSRRSAFFLHARGDSIFFEEGKKKKKSSVDEVQF